MSASDEFFYFPQVRVADQDWRVWDRFSNAFITDFSKKLSLWENEIDHLISSSSTADIYLSAQIKLLKKITCTLKEQLVDIRVWETQPSFYLTIVCLGLAEAIEKGNYQTRQRVSTLPHFLDQAGKNLRNIPVCFKQIGMEMVKDTRKYLIRLSAELPDLSESLDALGRFENRLKKFPSQSEFRMPGEKLCRVIEYHIHCDSDIARAEEIVNHEIHIMNKVLEREARTLGHSSWQDAYLSIPGPKIGEQGLVGLYRNETRQLGHHCRQSGIVDDLIYHDNPVKVMPVPDYLSAIRAASSYSIPPGHPPSGGIFYVIKAYDPDEFKKDYNREFKILSAHETWPGHHLLDIHRWNLDSPVLRPVEQPVFYEGWACFAEEILKITGYVNEPEERLIVAKRRLWRAFRGKVDLGLQTGALSLDQAADLLTQTGMGKDQAASAARKYLLNPGYQLCYTLGLRHFLNLYDQYGDNDIKRFTKQVLNHGEISFKDLKKILQKS